MLRYSTEQQAYLLNNRREFNARQAELASRFNGRPMIGNALPMPKDVWGQWDREGIDVQRQLLTVFNDLAATLATPIPIGKIVHFFQTISDSGQANVSLDGRAKGRTDQATYDYFGTPVPIIDSPFNYGWRQVEAARSEGFQLDSAGRTNSMFKVAQRLENIALDGDSTIIVNGQTLFGLRTHPRRNTRTTGQALNGATGAQWLADVVATLRLLHNDNFKVPAQLYVNFSDWFYANNTEFAAGYPKTIAQRVLESNGVAGVLSSDSILPGQIIALVKDRRVVQVLNAMPMSTRAQFRANPEDDYDFVTMAAAAVEVKFDAEQNCGVAVSSL